MPKEYVPYHKTVTIAQNATVSGVFRKPAGITFMGALFPAMDDGAIGLELSIDNGSNFYPLLDALDGSDAVLAASGQDPGIIDFSDFVRFVPDLAAMQLRFTCASQTTAEVDIEVVGAG